MPRSRLTPIAIDPNDYSLALLVNQVREDISTSLERPLIPLAAY